MSIRKVVTALLVCACIAVGQCAFADGRFLCMRADESTAITIDENGFYKYIEMRGSNGEIVVPKISTDWNTYLPFRFICEQMGLKDGSDIEGGMPDGYFRYLSAEVVGIPAVEICCGGQYYYHNIDIPFEYYDSEGNARVVSIYNVGGTLYMPMAYLAKITGAAAIWQAETSQIIYIGDTDAIYGYIDQSLNLYRYKMMQLEFDFYNNNIIKSPLYLKRDGVTIANLNDIAGENTRSITRSGFNTYYIDDNDRVKVSVEDWSDISLVEFTDEQGNAVDMYADTIMVIKDKLYGIQEAAPGDKYGLVFCCDLDGSNLRYLSNVPAYNLIFSRDQLDYYLFYGDAATRSSIHMIKMKTMDDYTIEVTDHSRNNLLAGMKQFAVCNNQIFYIDEYSRLRRVNSDYKFEDIEIVRADPSANRELLIADGGAEVNNVVSINLDYLNDILYIVQADPDGTKLYYYTPKKRSIRFLDALPDNAVNVSLFSDFQYNDTFAVATESGIYSRQMKYVDGDVHLVY